MRTEISSLFHLLSVNGPPAKKAVTKQAEDIYSLSCDFKHAAQAMLQKSTGTGAIDPFDQSRIDSVNLLHKAVRHLLLESLNDRTFADILADPSKLRQTYRALDQKGNLV